MSRSIKKKSPTSPMGQSQRQLRVGELIRHALADIFQRGLIMDDALYGKIITVPEVRVTADLKLATAFIMPLGGQDMEACVAVLNTHKRFLRGELAHRLQLKFVPEVRFRADTSFERGSAIDAVLQSPAVRRDTQKKSEPDPDDAL